MPANVKAVPAPPRSPPRQRLADAIAAHAGAVNLAERVAEAQAKIDSRLFDDLQPAVRAAQKLLKDARADAPLALVDRLLSDEPDAGGGPIVAQAEATLAATEQKLAEARQARSLLGEEAARTDAAVEVARRELNGAVAAVVSSDPTRAALVAEFTRSARHALRCAQALRSSGMVMQGAQAHGLRCTITTASSTIDKMGTAFLPDDDWQAAIALLKSDPDVPLPGPPEPEPDDTDIGAAAAAA